MRCTASVLTFHMPKAIITIIIKILHAIDYFGDTLHISKSVIIFVCSKYYAGRCSGSYLSHARSYNNVPIYIIAHPRRQNKLAKPQHH